MSSGEHGFLALKVDIFVKHQFRMAKKKVQALTKNRSVANPEE